MIKAHPTKLSTDLAAFVAEYHKHNYYFEIALAKRHERWKSRGLLKSVAPKGWPEKGKRP